KIVDIFGERLLYAGTTDKWLSSGKVYFAERVSHFLSQGIKVEFCLPAFPCKSPNTNKVIGKDPDLGEMLALERLHSFVRDIEPIYGPGAKIWIISDGHAFADCSNAAGVDDRDVDDYYLKLNKMNLDIGTRRGNTDRVVLTTLSQILELDQFKGKARLAHSNKLNMASIHHPARTKPTIDAEICRQILMAGCQSQTTAVKDRIESQDPPTQALYHGFTEVILEDLESHPHAQTIGISKRRQLASNVAFKMIMRNQAYSNLLAMVFPNHIRLSTHAQDNAGPKFAVQLFEPKIFRPVETLTPCVVDITPSAMIPTPWHYCVVKMHGSSELFVTKSKVVRRGI
ncbi:hypothetical protein M426DRAFT_48122, partial [Hypoxylon sp. CI-4A]